MLVHQRRPWLARGMHVHDRWQLVEIDEHLRRDVLGLRPGVRHAHGDHLAYLTHLVPGQHRLRRSLETGQTGVRHDGPHAGEIVQHEHRGLHTGGFLDAANARVGQRAAHEGHVAQADHAQIGHVFATPAQKAIILLALQPDPHALRIGRGVRM